MMNRLVGVDLRNDPKPAQEVIALLEPLLHLLAASWRGARDRAPVPPQPPTSRPRPALRARSPSPRPDRLRGHAKPGRLPNVHDQGPAASPGPLLSAGSRSCRPLGAIRAALTVRPWLRRPFPASPRARIIVRLGEEMFPANRRSCPATACTTARSSRLISQLINSLAELLPVGPALALAWRETAAGRVGPCMARTTPTDLPVTAKHTTAREK